MCIDVLEEARNVSILSGESVVGKVDKIKSLFLKEMILK